MIKYFCDFCGEEILGKGRVYSINIAEDLKRKKEKQRLCKKCWKEIIRTIAIVKKNKGRPNIETEFIGMKKQEIPKNYR